MSMRKKERKKRSCRSESILFAKVILTIIQRCQKEFTSLITHSQYTSLIQNCLQTVSGQTLFSSLYDVVGPALNYFLYGDIGLF